MSKMNILLKLLGFEQANLASSAPQKHFDWLRQVQSVEISCPESKNKTLDAYSSEDIFDYTVYQANGDGTTLYDLTSPTSGTYRISYESGAAIDMSDAEVGDSINIKTGFGDFKVNKHYTISAVDVAGQYIEFQSSESLTLEASGSPVFDIYNDYKTVVYLETNQSSRILLNGEMSESEPILINGVRNNGVFLRYSRVYSMTLQNKSASQANMFYILAK